MKLSAYYTSISRR